MSETYRVHKHRVLEALKRYGTAILGKVLAEERLGFAEKALERAREERETAEQKLYTEVGEMTRHSPALKGDEALAFLRDLQLTIKENQVVSATDADDVAPRVGLCAPCSRLVPEVPVQAIIDDEEKSLADCYLCGREPAFTVDAAQLASAYEAARASITVLPSEPSDPKAPKPPEEP